MLCLTNLVVQNLLQQSESKVQHEREEMEERHRTECEELLQESHEEFATELEKLSTRMEYIKKENKALRVPLAIRCTPHRTKSL